MAMLRNYKCRKGFTLLEVTVTAAVIAVVGIVVAQCIHISLRERARVASHQAACELAANILEEARARPIAKLDKAWADARVVPSEMAELLPAGKVEVSVESEKGLPHARRVSVDVRWEFEKGLPMYSVRLTTLLSERETGKGGTP